MERKHQTLEEVRIQRARMGELAEQVERMRQKAVDYDARIPAGRSFADLWRQIAELMNRHALSGQLVQPGSPVESDGMGAIPLTLSATGTMHDIYAFFAAIEHWDRLIRFEGVELTNDNMLSGTVKLTARAQLYYQIQSD
jgi:Tfp pilus assembly protein PilO